MYLPKRCAADYRQTISPGEIVFIEDQKAPAERAASNDLN